MPDPLRPSRWLGLIVVCLTIAGCATPRYAPPTIPGPAPMPEAPWPSAPPAPSIESRPVADLPGWSAEDHVAAYGAFLAGCRASSDPPLQALCRMAQDLGPLNEAGARRFFEAYFRAVVIPGDGLLTGYFSPEYEARDDPVPPFVAAVRPKPADLPLSPGEPYADRATIEAEDPIGALAWMRAEDLFFMQVQGSGLLDFPDGRRLRARFAGSNNLPFTPIAAPLRAQGALSPSASSGGAVRAWLADHRGAEAAAVMNLDRRYVFFAITPDDGGDPAGTAGVPLPAGRAIAVDASQHALGGIYWLDADSPSLSGGAPDYRRLVVALDTGGAIKGAVRADLYVGRGDVAGAEAGHIRHALRLYQLVPMTDFGQ
jgi:membrane-bound lytic murein transglycosylase A